MRARLYAVAVGIYLACLQVAFFLSLQTLACSTALTFALVTAAWLVGSGAGVWLPARLHRVCLLVSVAAPWTSQVLLESFPYRLEWLPVHAALISASSVYAGVFFQALRSRFRTPGQLFFWENNGFVLGLALATLAAMQWGVDFVRSAPAAGLLLLAFSRSAPSPRDS
ncbi:MAG: hypothetical protein AB1758_12755 [Candidatus Eremiobacterota bacterium]